jgi:hypothetical protein
MKLIVTVHVDENEAHDEGIENCVKFAVLDGLMDHFEFYRPELDFEQIYAYMRAKGFYVEEVKVEA